MQSGRHSSRVMVHHWSYVRFRLLPRCCRLASEIGAIRGNTDIASETITTLGATVQSPTTPAAQRVAVKQCKACERKHARGRTRNVQSKRANERMRGWELRQYKMCQH